MLDPITANNRKPDCPAVVLAAFGTSRPEALADLWRIKTGIETFFPDRPVEMSFTSNTIRAIWRRRRKNEDWRRQHPDLPPEVYTIQGPLAAVAGLQDRGYNALAVQSLHVYAGEEYYNLKAFLEALRSIRTIKPKHQPFNHLLLGRPALGEPGVEHDYRQDLKDAAVALALDAEAASKQGAALVYMGHGNSFFSSGIYLELQETMRRQYPGLKVFIGAYEGFPSLDQVLKGLKRSAVRQLILTPLLLTVGEHAITDMAGDNPGSWKSILTENGFKVHCLLRGLAALDAWSDIYLNHLQDVLPDQARPESSDDISEVQE